jgi:hypothetical protein
MAQSSVALVAKQGNTWTALTLDPESNFYDIETLDTGGAPSGAAASATTLNIIGPVVVKLGSGRLVTISLLGPGSIEINDAANLANAVDTNAVVNLSTPSGWVFRVDIPVINGIVVSAISGQATISYQ